jgi:hypothetical protein
MGRGDVAAVVVVLALVVASWIWFVAYVEPLSHRCNPPDDRTAGADRVTGDLGAAASRLPGVVAAEADYSPGDCDVVSVALTVDADAFPGQVAAAVAFVHARPDAPPLRWVDDVVVSVKDDGPEHSPGRGGPTLTLSDEFRATDAVATLARAWARLKGHYRGVDVDVDFYRDSFRVQLPRSADSTAVRDAFEVMRGLGLTERESASRSLFWDVGVAGPGPIHHDPDINYGTRRGDLPSTEGLAAIEAVAAWSTALGPEIVLVTDTVWSGAQEGDEAPGLTVSATVDVDTLGRTVDEVADDLAARLAGSGSSYKVQIAASTAPPRSTRRVSG